MSIERRTKIGTVTIDDNVIATIAGLSAIECYGIVGMAAKNVTDGIFGLLKKESLTKGINIFNISKSDDDYIDIELHVIVSYGTNIAAISDTLIETVKYSVENITDIKVNSVNVIVEGIRVLA